MTKEEKKDLNGKTFACSVCLCIVSFSQVFLLFFKKKKLGLEVETQTCVMLFFFTCKQFVRNILSGTV